MSIALVEWQWRMCGWVIKTFKPSTWLEKGFSSRPSFQFSRHHTTIQSRTKLKRGGTDRMKWKDQETFEMSLDDRLNCHWQHFLFSFKIQLSLSSRSIMLKTNGDLGGRQIPFQPFSKRYSYHHLEWLKF